MNYMPRHIFISQESTNDHISIFYNEPIFIVTADKNDLAKLSLLDEAHKPGIYILIGHQRRYIGQASSATFTRLQQHNLHKDWWNKVIFFGREDGHLSKAQLDYLESELIEEFAQTSLVLDNNTQGNISYIDKLGKITAKALLVQVKDTLANIANIDLLEENPIEENEPEENNDTDQKFVNYNGKKYTGPSARQIFITVITDVLKFESLALLTPLISDNEPNTVKFIGTTARISKSGTELTKKVNGTPYHIYINYSKDMLRKRLEVVAKATEKPIDIQL
ncbi:hypothetical protein SAMN05216341_1058 [Leuconostocaceae bacterium R-53105]|uniref:GIY-YIG domain-containing protein n=2 Tax=Convivina intestini TaxID=1505726 RepID=A0A2U1D7S3_9LACO|nr:hypothetical protein C7384_1067 [Convivina intestini]CAH1855193.1 hypothetical protein R077811_01013 [Convivina intestini]SDB92152.1 hypothetical protein SAMN05216341_1058 [Leuconostocaceae bacterium R-53105]